MAKKKKTIIRRLSPRRRYLIIDKSAATDHQITLAALGLHTKLMAKPDDWEIFFSQLAEETRSSERTIRNLFNELQQFGYAVRRQVVDRASGRLVEWILLVCETPAEAAEIRADLGNTYVIHRYPHFQRNTPDGAFPHCGESTLWTPHHVDSPDVDNDRLQKERIKQNERLKEKASSKSGKTAEETASGAGRSGAASPLPAVLEDRAEVSGIRSDHPPHAFPSGQRLTAEQRAVKFLEENLP